MLNKTLKGMSLFEHLPPQAGEREQMTNWEEEKCV